MGRTTIEIRLPEGIGLDVYLPDGSGGWGPSPAVRIPGACDQADTTPPALPTNLTVRVIGEAEAES